MYWLNFWAVEANRDVLFDKTVKIILKNDIESKNNENNMDLNIVNTTSTPLGVSINQSV